MELKIVITGTVGAGKTTAIQSISEIPVISTEVEATDEVALEKETTTVAMDYGELSFDDGSILKIYGTPGQERFSYMWEILATGALGLIILVNDRRQSSLADLDVYLDNFRQYIDAKPIVVGVTHLADEQTDMEKYHDHMAKRGLYYPVFPLDARRREDVGVVIQAMAAMITD